MEQTQESTLSMRYILRVMLESMKVGIDNY